MVGGGQGAFIGSVHRIAARMDDAFDLVAGAFSSDPERCRASAREVYVTPERAYDDFAEMARIEAERPDGIDVVAIVVPNHLHFPVAKAFLEAGIHVICDKPMTTTVEDAEALVDLADRSGLVFVLTHNYSGYPMVRAARALVQSGELGAVRVVNVEYPQEWLAKAEEAQGGNKQAEWRVDPERAGLGGCVGDIGTHAFHLAEFVSGLTCESVAADLARFVPGRRLDDNVHVMMRYSSGARGLLWASQVAPGNANGLRLRILGERGGLEWFQETPEELRVTPLDAPTRILRRNGPGSDVETRAASRLPAGHPEGFLEGFGQIYRDAADLIRAKAEGRSPRPSTKLVPGLADGLRGVRFIHAVVRSSTDNSAWTQV
jgi:predicted dehydrogenase